MYNNQFMQQPIQAQNYSNAYNSYLPPQQRLAQYELQQNQQYLQQMGLGQNLIKGRPVVSLEEARASQIDLDGSLYVFTDIGNDQIYTKQILNGAADLRVYRLVDVTQLNGNNDKAESISYEDFVTKNEFEQVLGLIKEEINEMIKQKESVVLDNEQRTTKSNTIQSNF